MKASRKFLNVVVLSGFLVSVLLFAVACGAAWGEDKAGGWSATYAHGVVSVILPYHAERSGAGRLEVELIDPEDRVLGRAERSLNASKGDGRWLQDVPLTRPIAVEELAWERLRYRFVYNGDRMAALEGTESVSKVLKQPVLRVMAQRMYLAGSRAAVRAIVTDSAGEPVVGRSALRVELMQQGQAPRLLFSGRLDQRGTTAVQIRFPAGLVGAFQLRTSADTVIGEVEYTQDVRLEETTSILLTTEKPIYQPGQTIHVRALALERADHHAAAERSVVLEVEDSKGNKVFRRSTKTDAFGIASAEFGLADEVNLGTYHLRAVMYGQGKPEASESTTAQLALQVEKYVLPKFNVQVEFTRKDGKAKKDYRPGDHVTGTVRANYFFGKAVDGAGITVKASSMDVSVFDAATEKGKTDKDGTYAFDLTLPRYIAGKGLNQGAAKVLIEATVTDGAAHAETHGEPVTVSQSPLLVMAVPEGGRLVPGMENEVYVLVSTPDGTPAVADVTVKTKDGREQKAATDKSGIAVVRVKGSGSGESISVRADAHHGNFVARELPLESRSGTDQMLLRVDRAVYRAGDRMQVQVLSSKRRGSVYVDIVKDGQTVLTRDVDVVEGRAEMEVPVTPEMAGTLNVNAYMFGRDAQQMGDHRLIFVQPADELKIEAVADAAVYKPGAEAKIRFRVTNAKGEGVSAALGLQIVDEAVFALAEKQPGFAKVFFFLEQEAMKPRYEIHSLSMESVVEPAEGEALEQQNRAARVLFSATEMANPNQQNGEVGASVSYTKYAEFEKRYRAMFEAQVGRLTAGVGDKGILRSDGDAAVMVRRVMTSRGAPPKDAWGKELRVEAPSYGPKNYCMVRSAGPDGEFDTVDDLTMYLQVSRGADAETAERGGRIDVDVEHDRGAFNGHAELTGSVQDASGAIVPRARVAVKAVAGGAVRSAESNVRGEFTVAGLLPGRYRVSVTAQGFKTSVRELAVVERDRAMLHAVLDVGSVTETVTVSDQVVAVADAGAADLRIREVQVLPSPRPQSVVMMAMGMAGVVANHDVRSSAVRLGMAAAMGAPMAKTPAASQQAAEPAHVRSYFPEALYIAPEIVTDGAGRAEIAIPMADSITTWRMAMVASTKAGALGTGTSSMKVFQDFFVDLDMPVTLTQGDRVSIPVAVYNYASQKGDVRLKLEPDAWYSLVDDAAEKGLSVAAGRVGGSHFTVQANKLGKFKLKLTARMEGGSEREDVVEREIEVVPNGQEKEIVFNGRLDGSVKHEVRFPTAAIADASKVFVRLYPGPMSQIIEGMDGVLRMPGGCFEQTSSSTYPNVLALDYMKRTKKLTPEVHAKAEGYIANGYQRLLTFEVPGGGFSWFGQTPANKILTSYGLMEFHDMAQVYDLDPKLIQRTSEWLAGQQQPNGSWKPDTQFINEGATNRFNTDTLRITAYIAWALEVAEYRGPAVDRARKYISEHLDDRAGDNADSSRKPDAYTLAVLANFAVDGDKSSDLSRRVLQMLVDARTESGEMVSWTSEQTGMYGSGKSAAVETTGLAVQALLKSGQEPELARKALGWIVSQKGSGGNWGTTQATIMALRALVLASGKSGADAKGSVEVLLNGKSVETLTLTPENNDLLQQFVLPGVEASAANQVEIRFSGSGGLAYQVAGRYFVPWEQKAAAEALAIDVAYDRTRLAQDDVVAATAVIRNNLPKTANMVMVDLGIPPGFDLLSEDLQDMVEKTADARSGKLEKFSLTATQAILYFDSIGAKSTVNVRFRLRAKYPIRAKNFESRVYEYYDPTVSATAVPVQFEVKKK